MASFYYNHRSLNNSIEDLPTEILCIIFSFCDAKTLCRISCTCKRFNDILREDDKVWKNAANKSLITNLISPIVQERYVILNFQVFIYNIVQIILVLCQF
jgi:hypothetical protein